MLYKYPYYAQTPANSLALCTALPTFRAVEQVGHFFLAPVCVCGWAFTLTFHFCQLCGAWSLLIKDIGEEMVTCELLQAVWVLLTELVVPIVEFRLTTWQGFHETLIKIKRHNFLRESPSWRSVQLSFMLRCSMPSGSWVPREKEQVASIECIYQGNVLLCSYPPISVSQFLPTSNSQASTLA